jgi:hypothetical protein
MDDAVAVQRHAARNLNHPHLAPLHTVIAAGTRPFLHFQTSNDKKVTLTC